MISSNSDNAKSSEVASHESLEVTEKGKEVVGVMLEAIEDISTSNEEIMQQMNENNKEMKDLVTVISEIGSKTKIINDIVFQTKLLSFNASVEAARAGEHGKGFAVVAEEIGKLAALSGAASVEINELLEKSIKKVEETVTHSTEKVNKLIQNGKTNIEKGNHVALECREVLNEIVESVSEVTNRVSEIANASKEQSLGVQEITKAVSQLDQVTQINSSNSTESAKAAEKLSKQALNLRKQVANLVATVDGYNAESIQEMKELSTEIKLVA
jgi:methyl-accepting chemotaxis protein